ncbi:MAG: tetratricopeptide repeat protein [Candidatus Thorarchaeota archaeon]
MEPLGTITMYYPFIDSETRNAIKSIMNDSRTYREFSLALGARVCDNDVPIHLAYLAAVHSWQLTELEMIQRIAAKYPEYAIIRPWTICQRIPDKTGMVLSEIRQSIENAIAAKPENWILAQLPQVSEGFPGLATEFPGFVESILEILTSQPDLECFKAGFHNIRCWIHAIDDNTEKAIAEIEAGLETARKYDDRYRIMKLLIDLANLTKNSDVRLALDHLENAYAICTELDAIHEESVILNEMGLVSTILGEYDLALNCHLDSVHSEEREEIPGYFTVLNLSHAYHNLDDHLEAFAWAESAMKSADPGNIVWSHLAMARSLIGLGLLDKASDHLDRAKPLSLKSGHESVLGQYYYVLGICEIARGDPRTAIETLKQALDIYKRQNILLYVVYCSLALTQAELAIAKTDSSYIDAYSSGPWLSELWKLAEDYNLPGIMMSHDLMKSELQILQGKTESARETLENALSVSDSPGVKSLRRRIISKIQSLDAEL